MKKVKGLVLLYCILGFYLNIAARTLEVGKGKMYARVQEAARQARPGDIILIRGGIYNGNESLPALTGTGTAWITIKSAPKELVIFRGGSFAMQLSNPAYVKISGLVFEGQEANGVNIDDGGNYQATAHHVIIENCEWRSMNATGNNDELKLSGLRNFIIRNCRFYNGAKGGSLVDMVGCHAGTIENNTFKNAGADVVQAKGGSNYITIRRNRFTNGGQRSINIGGSTGQEYFRPAGATYEGSNIYVHATIFTGSDPPFAFVGANNCEVNNNNIIHPNRWALRI